MFICDHKHDEVVYAGRPCPPCEAQEEINRLQEVCEQLREEIKKLEENR